MSLLGLSSAPDYFRSVRNPASDLINLNETFRSRVDSRYYGTSHGVFLIFGQSNSADFVQGSFSPVNLFSMRNLNAFSGGTFLVQDPLLGCNGTSSNLFVRMADKLITNGKYSTITLIPVGVGSTSMLQWRDSLYEYLVLGYRRAAALGLPVSGVLMQIGETDGVNGVSSSDWVSWTNATRTKVEAAGCLAPWMVAKSTFWMGSQSENIRSAVDTLWANGYLVGPDTDPLNAPYRYDGAHFTEAGADFAAEWWKDRIVAYL